MRTGNARCRSWAGRVLVLASLCALAVTTPASAAGRDNPAGGGRPAGGRERGPRAAGRRRRCECPGGGRHHGVALGRASGQPRAGGSADSGRCRRRRRQRVRHPAAVAGRRQRQRGDDRAADRRRRRPGHRRGGGRDGAHDGRAHRAGRRHRGAAGARGRRRRDAARRPDGADVGRNGGPCRCGARPSSPRARTSAARTLVPENPLRTGLEGPAPHGFTALLFAVRAGHAEVVRALLEAGADPDDRLPDGTGTLVLAATNAHWELGLLLVEAGADPNARRGRGGRRCTP